VIENPQTGLLAGWQEGAESMTIDIRVTDKIEKIASDIASNFKSGQTRIDQQILDLETRLAKLHAERNDVSLAPDRAANMEVSIDNQYQCPWCWVMIGIHANMRPVPSDSAHDVFRCQKCRNELRVYD
jgi:hypothetical protein